MNVAKLVVAVLEVLPAMIKALSGSKGAPKNAEKTHRAKTDYHEISKPKDRT